MQTLSQLPLTNGSLLVDNSFLESFTTCPRKWENQYGHKRISAHENDAISFGTVMHSAFEYRYLRCQNNTIDSATEDFIRQKIFVPYFAKHPPSEDDHRTLDWAVEIFQRYNQRYVIEPFNLLKWKEPVKCSHCSGTGILFPDENNHILQEGCFWCEGTGKQEIMTELTFTQPLFNYEVPVALQPLYGGKPSIPIIYVGRIDLPVIWDGSLIVGDHKNVSTLGEMFVNSQKCSPQYEGYCWAFEQLTGMPVSGFFINGVRTKAKPATTRKGSWDDWWADCFERHKEYLRPGQIEEWKENTIANIQEFFFDYERQYFPAKKKSCTMYGKCAYYDVCYLPKEQREFMLASAQYKDNTWSPLKEV